MRILGDKVLVKVASAETVSEGGIILSAAKADRRYEGTVVGTGEHKDIAKAGISVGTYVYYVPGMNTEIDVNGEVHDVVSVYDVLAKVEE